MANKFGGTWTMIKLDLLKKYLEAYANVFKYQHYFKLIYIDAFAGSGKCDTRLGILDGSTKIALNIERFDEYIFIEQDKENYAKLVKLKNEYPNKKINLYNENCNDIINSILNRYNWSKTRALAFLDPYQMELSFETLKQIAITQAIDLWYLFPLGKVTRTLRKDGKIESSDEERLNILLGESDWKTQLYQEKTQLSFFDTDDIERKDQEDICCYFRNRLLKIFPSVRCPVCLKNSNNSPLFALYFAISNPSKTAQDAANKIAGYLIEKEGTFVCISPQKRL